MRKRIHDSPGEFDDVVILDWFFYQKFLLGPCKDLFLAMKYFTGKRPCLYGKAWTNAKKVYTFFHIKGKHWIALEINLHGRFVTFYDCNRGFCKDGKIETALSFICKSLPKLMKSSGLFGDIDDSPFVIVRADVPQDSSG